MYNVYMCVYIYIYIYMFTERERERETERERERYSVRSASPGLGPRGSQKIQKVFRSFQGGREDAKFNGDVRLTSAATMIRVRVYHVAIVCCEINYCTKSCGRAQHDSA